MDTLDLTTLAPSREAPARPPLGVELAGGGAADFGAPPAHMGRRPINAFLAKNSALFPLDASWVDMHHDKGQLARSTAAWVECLIEKRLEDGERPEEILLQCWIMSFSGLMHGLGYCDILTRRRPESARVLFDPDLGKPILARLAREFLDASTSWTPPVSMALRGWGKMRLEQDIQDGSRIKFAWIAHLCLRTAEIGLPEMLRRCAGHDMDWLALPDEEPNAFPPAQIWSKQPQVPHIALSFMIRAQRDAWIQDQQQSTAQLVDLLSLACMGFSPKNFRVALVRFCPDPIAKALMGAAAARKAAFTTHAASRSVEQRLIALEKATLAAESAAAPLPPTDNEYDDEYEDGLECDFDFPVPSRPRPFATERRALHAEACEVALRSRRTGDALAYLAQWCQSQLSGAPALMLSYFQGTLGCDFGNPEAHHRAENLLLAVSSKLKLSSYALGLAQCARDHGYPLDISPEARRAVWASHNNAFKNLLASNIPNGFAARHLSLAFNFPDEAGENLSLSIAPAPMLAQIEFAEISRLVARHVPDGLGEDDGEEPPLPTRKLRL